MSITGQSAREAPDWVRGAPASSSIALNGSVDPDCDALARAAQNVARWKNYLSEECVRAMMSSGWHWST